MPQRRSLLPAGARSLRTVRVAAACALGIGLVTIGVVLYAPGWLVERLQSFHPGCLYRIATRAPLVALTIDDGPDSISTPLLLQELRRSDAQATFFLIADRVPGQEALVRAIVAGGHELGNHFVTDRAGIRLGAAEFENDLLQADRMLSKYDSLVWARPASGWYTGKMVAIMHRHGYRCALGSVYPFDAALPSPSFAAAYILRNIRPGSIVVLHDGGARGRRTAEVLKTVLPQLRRRGFRVVTLSNLVTAS